VKFANLVVIFDAHAERVDQYRQQNATRKVAMIDKALHIPADHLPLDCKNQRILEKSIRISTDILWRICHILTEPVLYTLYP